LIKDTKFKNDLDDYDKMRKDQLAKLSYKAIESIKTLIENHKNFNELYIDIEEIKNDLLVAMESVEKDYWKHIKEYVTLYLNKPEKDIVQEMEDIID